MATYSVIIVADAILKIAKGRGRSLTPLQLMKLTYIANGFSLAMRGKNLFSERIEAWKYGPVIPDLYRATKHYGREPIPLDKIGDDPPSVDPETLQFLEDVFDKYGHLTGFALSSLTHKKGAPWDRVYQEGVMNISIPADLIKKHYQGIVDGRQ